MDLLGVISNGLIFGLVLTIMIGPVFFSLIQTSIENGYLAGFQMAVGIVLSDMLYIAICFFGISQLINNEKFKILIGFLGGIILFGFGLVNLLKPIAKKGVRVNKTNGTSFFSQFLKGIFVNGINPFVFIFWLGAVSMAGIKYSYSTTEVILFFLSITITVFITDNIKAFLASKLSNIVTSRFIRIMNTIAGIALIAFSIRLFYYAYELGYENLF